MWRTASVVLLSLFLGWPGVARADTRVTFRDVTAPAGIDFQHTNGRAGESYVIEVKGSGVAFLDYDNDGDLDLYAVNGNNLPGAKTEARPVNHLYRNDGDGTFTDVTAEAGVGDGGYGHGVACADFDNDGDQDIYIANYGPNVLYRNEGDGTFTDVSATAGVAGEVWSASAAFCDLDNDGWLDLYVANYLVFDIKSSVKLPTGPGFYDGEPDVLYLNNGDGTFRDVTRQNIGNPDGKGLGVVCFDYDNDGDLEVYVANDGVVNLLYENKGHAVFEDVTLFSGTGVNGAGETEAGMGVDAGDYDNDGDMDLFVTNYKGESNTLMRNDGSGVFTDVTSHANLVAASLPYVTFGTAFLDYDNDGDLDIFVANGHTEEDEPDHEQPDQLFENLGNGRYEDASSRSGPPFAVKRVGRGVAVGDFDNDGDVDLVVSNKNGPLMLLQNDGGDRGNWLVVRTRGTRSNRDGIGARLKIVAPGFERSKDVKTGYSMFSSGDPRVYFGLGQLKQVDLEIRWPSGQVDKIRDVPANKLVTVTEGAGSGVVAELEPIDTDYGVADEETVVETRLDPAQVLADVERLRAAIDVDSTDLESYLQWGEAYVLWITGRTRQHYDSLLAANPHDPAALFAYGDFRQSKRELNEAIELFEQAAALQPESLPVQTKLAGLYLRLGRYEDCVRVSRRRTELGDQTADADLGLGRALFGLGRTEEALATFLALLERHPESVEGRLELGRLYADTDRLEQAVAVYRAAVQRDPGVRESRYRLAEVYRRAGDVQAYEREMATFDLLETESVLFKGGMPPEAEAEILQREIRMNPLFGRTRADRHLARSYDQSGNREFKELFSLRARASDLKDRLNHEINGLRLALLIDSTPEQLREFKEINAFRLRLVQALNRTSRYELEEATVLAARAREALASGAFDDALTGFNSALVHDPDNLDAYRGLVRLFLSARFRLDYARQLARKSTLLDQSPDTYGWLAEVYSELGDEASADQARQIASALR